MTDEQRERIISLRQHGFGYTAIANAVGLKKENIKAFCRKHGLGGMLAESNARISLSTDFCLNCGKPLVQQPGVKRRKFCCSECRTKWWNTHQNIVNKKAVYHFTCPACGKDFTTYGNAKRKYCCHECYIKARFRRTDAI